MAVSLTCADTGQDCPASFTTETEDELMRHVEMHAGAAHPDMVLDEATVEQVKGLVRKT